jgi:hypothetical protein
VGKGNKNAGDAGHAVKVVAAEPARSQNSGPSAATTRTHAMGKKMTGAHP